MNLSEMIDKRKSVRSFGDDPVSAEVLEKLEAFIADAKPLYPEIKVDIRVAEKENVRFYFPWKSRQLLAVFSENKPGYLENVGFILQQVDLYLQSLGIGTCWLGLGKLRSLEDAPNGLDFVILMAFGHTKPDFLRTSAAQFKRKSMEEISDICDRRLEPARLAPSSTNSQPWYFAHEGDMIHAYRDTTGEHRHKMLGYMNRIDMGIALSHLYVSSPDSFRFVQAEVAREGYEYIGTITL